MGEDRSQQERTEASVPLSVVKAIPDLEIRSVGNLLWRLSWGLPGLDTVAQALTKVSPSYRFPPSVKHLSRHVWKSKWYFPPPSLRGFWYQGLLREKVLAPSGPHAWSVELRLGSGFINTHFMLEQLKMPGGEQSGMIYRITHCHG